MADRYGTAAITGAVISNGRSGTGIIISGFAEIIFARSTSITSTAATGLWMRTRQNAGAAARASNWEISQEKFGITLLSNMSMPMACASRAIAAKSSAIGLR